MIELPLVLLSGVLGSSHCIGMCGPFALAIGGHSATWKANVSRQLGYSAGRIFTYLVLGAAAGFGGWRLGRAPWPWVNVTAVLAIAAGGLLIYQGLKAAGVLRVRGATAAAGPCLGGSFLATYLAAPGWHNTVLAGVFTGFLPCGLVYAFLALAASSSNMWSGAAVMGAFGLGTVPVMVLTGCGSSLLTVASRRFVFRAAAWSLVVAGLISIARGAGFISVPGWFVGDQCPLCW